VEQKYNKKEICPYLNFGKINKNTKVKDYQVVTAILYRLKTEYPRKKSKTTNNLIITDSQGIPLVCSNPIAGNHNDAYQLEDTFSKMLRSIQIADIPIKGLFLNADSGFDTSGFRSYCFRNEIFDNIDKNKRNRDLHESYTVFDELLYKTRFVIERTNAWLDAFKAILVRFETNNLHWKALLLLAFSVILLRKL